MTIDGLRGSAPISREAIRKWTYDNALAVIRESGAVEVEARDRRANPNAPMFSRTDGGPLITRTGRRYLLVPLREEPE